VKEKAPEKELFYMGNSSLIINISAGIFALNSL